MGAVKLGFVATFLSDPLISGFTTGSAVIVVISQLKHIFGIKVPQISGAFASVKVWSRNELILFSHRSAEDHIGNWCFNLRPVYTGEFCRVK